MYNKINVLIAEDHPLVREGITDQLNTSDKINIIGAVKNGMEALTLIDDHHVDVVISDLNMPIMNGLELTKAIHSNGFNIKVIILTMLDEPEYIRELIGLGADGYILKSNITDELERAVIKVYSGATFISDEVMSRLTTFLTGRGKSMIESKFNINVNLSGIETKVLELITKKRNSLEISNSLSIDLEKVDWVIKNLLKKTRCKSLTGLLIYSEINTFHRN